MKPSVSAKRPKNYREKVFFRKLRTQIDGSTKVEYGLTQIKGVGRRFAQAVVSVANIDPNLRVGVIAEKDLNKLEEIILDPLKYGIPNDMVNRQNDPREGEDQHIIGNKLDITVRRDVDKMRRNKRVRSLRHSFRLGVRGLRSKHFSIKPSKSQNSYKKIYSLMKESDLNVLEVNQIYLPEVIVKELLNFETKITIKEEFRNYLKVRGIGIKHTGEFFTFYLID